MSTPAKSSSSGRLSFLDWTRGLAALTMLNGHVFHSFTHKDLREGSPYVLTQFMGGMPPAVFLFLTGITLAFLMDSRTKQQVPQWERVKAALNRAGFLITVAILFRVQMFVFAAGKSPWTDLFKFDILNSMALAIAMLAPLALVTTRTRVRYGLFIGLAIACATPLITMMNWSALHPFLRTIVVPDTNGFAFFPWASYLAFGVCAGSILRLTPDAEMGRVMQWSMLLGIVLIGASRYAANLPYSLYPKSDFWLDSPALVFIKIGVTMIILSIAYLWTRHLNPSGWSVLRQLGTTSLLVYWVHTELVYGTIFWMFKENLSVASTMAMSGFIITLMIGLSVLKTGWGSQPGMAVLLRKRWHAWRWTTADQPVSGD